MARRKTQPDLVQAKCHLAERLRQIRTELFGDRGGPEMSRRLNLPVRTWYNYEAGVTVPAEVLLRFVELTGVEPLWLAKGKGPRFRSESRAATGSDNDSISSLLRAVLSRLEERRTLLGGGGRSSTSKSFAPRSSSPSWLPNEKGEANGTAESNGSRWQEEARQEWDDAQRDGLRVKVLDDSMRPIIEPGGIVVFKEEAEEPQRLEGGLVVAWLENSPPIVRWYQRSGRFAMLRAENPTTDPNTLLLPLDAASEYQTIRRVVWISTPRT
ncbi:MAG: hypothetical protein NVSMB14_11070 [Isosphaeraceae bacterium]